MDTIITDGTVVTESAAYQADVGIADGVIITLGANLSAPGTQVIDAHGIALGG